MKYIVTGNTMVTVSIEVEAESGEEAIEIAGNKFEGVHSYCGNGGVDKLIGVNGNKESIAADAPVEFDDWIEP